MEVGSSAPRYHDMVALHPKSKELATHGIEYFVLIVQLCIEAITVCNQSAIGQLQTFFKSRTIATFKSDLLRSSNSINEQLALEEAREVSKARMLIDKFSSAEIYRAKLKARLDLLKGCSEFNYQKAWKQSRKWGNATWIHRNAEYKTWRDDETPSTLVVVGKLGAGKTVLLANMVDDLLDHSRGYTVVYHFCRSDDRMSLSPRTVMGCVARQVIEPWDLGVASQMWQTMGPKITGENIRELFKTKDIKGQSLCFILDGIDECGQEDREGIMNFLEFLHENIRVKFCISCRLKGDFGILPGLDRLVPQATLIMTDENPDINDYIQAQLELNLESGRMVVGDPAIVLEIQQALEDGAQGM